MSVKLRQELERRIVTKVLQDALAAGYRLNVDNGEDGESLTLDMTNEAAILAAMFATDDDILHVYKGEQHVGWVRFIYGNSGWDVISDYSTSLEDVVKGGMAIGDKYS